MLSFRNLAVSALIALTITGAAPIAVASAQPAPVFRVQTAPQAHSSFIIGWIIKGIKNAIKFGGWVIHKGEAVYNFVGKKVGYVSDGVSAADLSRAGCRKANVLICKHTPKHVVRHHHR